MEPVQLKWGKCAVKLAEATVLQEIHGPLAKWLRRFAKKTGRLAGRIFDWVTGANLVFPEKPKATNGGQILASLLTTIFVQVVAFIAFLQNTKHPPRNVLISYVLLSIVPIGGIVAVMRAHQGNFGRKKQYCFDQGAIMFGRWCFFSTTTMVALVTWAAYCGALPGQEPKELKLSLIRADSRAYENTSEQARITHGDVGVVVYARLSPRDFDAMGRPDPVFLPLQQNLWVKFGSGSAPRL